jgi:hypothetical protein
MLRFLVIALAFVLPGSAAVAEIRVYRCVQTDGGVSLQDAPCPPGQDQTSRNMTRPQDPPAHRTSNARRARPEPDPAPTAPEFVPADLPPVYPPPPLFQCTDFDGQVRFSEHHDPNTRCVPLAVLGFRVRSGTQAANTCRWVTESCLRLDDASACDRFRRMLRTARSDALHAFSSTAAFRRSEVTRLERIVSESCR